MTALYVSWVWTVTGCDLTIPRVFKTQLVHRYLAEDLAKRSETYRYDTARQLSAMADKLGDIHVQRLRMPEQTGSARPYSPAEEATLFAWANTLTTPLKRQNARALLALSGGAGLSAQELMDAQVQDVEFVTGRLFVNVRGDRARRVPVHSKWARTLAESIGNRTRGDLFHAYRLSEYKPNGLQRFLSDNPGPLRPSAARLRSGWIVAQIDAELPMQVLLEITGFATLLSLQPYLEHSIQHRADDHIGRIIGEEVA
ncbi:hypothetical protein [Diaminobutyricimonas sp. LJ205]|uniref:hypothetical protein n=1 Tax=Diaminobutyricimonas sp. LJ205 TaxID=2683590 RepID=UPI0012F4CB53|nr:hypothetical protein [Diaminobutyricimonas sp. LJ205]